MLAIFKQLIGNVKQYDIYDDTNPKTVGDKTVYPFICTTNLVQAQNSKSADDAGSAKQALIISAIEAVEE